ncbi:MAG: phospholipid carrier-dependent glycosyltransferase [Candidatus Rokubacteria bacterium]|nr:phospholipid carrier-dependent glycosyltransferase [Candidatus Rokubacteria bacterium]
MLVLVGLVVAALALTGLGRAPFIDPPEGFHAEIAREMAARGDWITPRLNGVRYFDKPPLPYWLMAASFAVAGPTPTAARVWGAVAVVGVALVTAALGLMLRGPRLALLAGLFVAANLGVFLYGRILKPDLPFVFFIWLGWLGIAIAWRAGPRPAIRGPNAAPARAPDEKRRVFGLALFYAALALAALTKDFLGAVGPMVALAVTLWWTGERARLRWFPWWGLLILGAVAAPWYLAVELQNRGFLWYTLVDNHVMNVMQQRAFPDEDVPLGALEFLAVTIGAFLPWIVAVPVGIAQTLAQRPRGPIGKLWRLVTLWGVAVVVVFTISPFKLPHYALPAFPAFALLAARAWDAALAGPRGARRVILPALAVCVMLAGVFLAMTTGVLKLGADELTSVDVATRNFSARGQSVSAPSLEAWGSIMAAAAAIFGAAAVLLAVAAWRRAISVAVVATVGAMLAFLPAAGVGMGIFADVRSLQPVANALTARARPTDLVVHEGALENSGSLLIALGRPVHVVNGLRSNLAYGATFADSRDVFWDTPRLVREWSGRERRFLVSITEPDASVVRWLPADRVHLLARSTTHWLYSNLAD